jgi:hypothetical protein
MKLIYKVIMILIDAINSKVKDEPVVHIEEKVSHKRLNDIFKKK